VLKDFCTGRRGCLNSLINPRSWYDFPYSLPLPEGEGAVTAAPYAILSLWEVDGVRTRISGAALTTGLVPFFEISSKPAPGWDFRSRVHGC